MQNRTLPQFGARGLVGVDTQTLKHLLRAFHRGKCRFPVMRSDLIAMGFGDWEEHMSVLSGLDEKGARAVLVAVIAEREARAREQNVPEAPR